MPIYKMEGKKDGQQRYRVRINYVDKNGKAKQLDRTVYGKTEAKLLESKLLNSVKKEPVESTRTLSDLFEEYVSFKCHEVRESSLQKSVSILEKHVIPYFADVKISKLNASVITEWKIKINEKGLKITTRQNIYTEFRTLLNYAVKMEYLAKNPLVAVGNFKDAYHIENNEDKMQYYTAEEFRKYIEIARKNASCLTDWGYYVFFNIAFYTGMRKGEINALKWTDIENECIHVRRSIAQKLKGGDRETPPKNKSSYRVLQMPQPLIDILEEHKARQTLFRGFSEDYRICGGSQCLRDTSLSNKNKAFAQEAGVKTIRIHDFRHSHATLLANEGINIQEIARRLGHSNIEVTWGTYAHLYPREEERAIKILNKIV